jgi:hypothetical protein
MVGCLVLAAALRGVNVGVQPLWTDEGFTGMVALRPDLFTLLSRDVHPPVYFVMIQAWAGLAGVSELALRWPSVLFGVLSVAAIVPLTRELMHLRPRPTWRFAPLAAAALMAVAEMEFYIAQEARSYTLHVLLGIAGTWALLRWARTGQRRVWLAWVGLMTVLVYTHYLGAWVGVVHGLYALLFLRGARRWQAVAGLMLAAGLFAVWLVGVVIPYQLAKADSDAIIDPSTPETLLSYARGYLTQQWPLMLGLLGLGLVAVRAGRWRVRPLNAAVLLVLWMVVPLMLTFIGNTRFSIMTVYRVSMLTVPLVVLWAFGLGAFARPARAFLLMAVLVYGVVNVDFYRPKFPEREFAALVSTDASAGDAVMIDMNGADFSPYYYLRRDLPPEVGVWSLRQYAIWDSQGLYGVMLPALYAAPTVWVLRWNDTPVAFELLAPAGHVQTAYRSMTYDGNLLEAYRFDQPSVFDDGAPLARFGDDLTLHAARFSPERLRVELWWSAGATLQADLTTSAFVLDSEGRLVAQYDSAPYHGERPTSTWQVGEVVYEPKPMRLTDGERLPAGRYTVGVLAYRYNPDGTLTDLLTEAGARFVTVGAFEIAPDALD